MCEFLRAVCREATMTSIPEEDANHPESAFEASECLANDGPGSRVRACPHRVSRDGRGDEHIPRPDGAIFAAHFHRD